MTIWLTFASFHKTLQTVTDCANIHKMFPKHNCRQSNFQLEGLWCFHHWKQYIATEVYCDFPWHGWLGRKGWDKMVHACRIHEYRIIKITTIMNIHNKIRILLKIVQSKTCGQAACHFPTNIVLEDTLGTRVIILISLVAQGEATICFGCLYRNQT